MIAVCFQGKLFNITVLQVYARTTDAKEDEVDQFYEDQGDLLELAPKKKMLYSSLGIRMQSRKSRYTWSKTQIWPWRTK